MSSDVARPSAKAPDNGRPDTKRDNINVPDAPQNSNAVKLPAVGSALYVTAGIALVAAVLAYALGLFPSYHLHLPAFFAPPCASSPSPPSDGFSRNVSSCPGYALSALHHTLDGGLTAQLTLAGPPCTAFGHDILDLTIVVAHETRTRLRVTIADADEKQFRLPQHYFPRPAGGSGNEHEGEGEGEGEGEDGESELVFEYDPAPFAFWISRKESGDVLFDTRPSSLPNAPTAALDGSPLDGFGLVFEDSYVQLTSALPYDANVYGLGEAVATAGFRRDVARKGTVQTMWARDAADPEDENMYGSHAVYLDHRVPSSSSGGPAHTHAVFLSSAAGADVVLTSVHADPTTTDGTTTTPNANSRSFIQFRTLGGILDLYIFSGGPSPLTAIEQYGALVGLPAWIPYWSLGFHLCRWGYESVQETREVVREMRRAGVPLEVMWIDIDLYHDLRDFTADPVRFAPEDVRAFIRELTANGQHYIPILDAAIPHIANDTDNYLPFITGAEQDLFIKNPDGSTYIGQVWPGYTVWPDWFADGVERWWAAALANWSALGVEFSGIWLDMNEPSSFCVGSCGTGADLRNTTPPILFPGDEGDPVTDWPEGYDATAWGTSGNITVDGQHTFSASAAHDTIKPAFMHVERGAARDPNDPPYAIHNGWGDLAIKTVAPNATHAGGLVDLDVHNLFGYMGERATHLGMLKNRPDERPFIISRSTFPSSGHWTGHWLGDNFSKWSYLRYSIQGVLQFQIFQIPMVGADTCGFNGNANEELCNRWMSLSAFLPFYRNHNVRGAISQEPYRWDSVAAASRAAIAIRYAMLPHWYTLFADAATQGTPPVRALLWEFPDEAELLAVDLQFMIGPNILVSPVTSPNVSTVDAILPGRGTVIWRDWYTHKQVALGSGALSASPVVTFDAPLGYTPVHVRGGAALLLHARPGYTTAESRAGPFELLVSLDATGTASGHAYIDDGRTPPPTANRTLRFDARPGVLVISTSGTYNVGQKLERITVLGVAGPPRGVWLTGGSGVEFGYDPGVQRLRVSGLVLSLNEDTTTVSWA